jgi:hypothetical protein
LMAHIIRASSQQQIFASVFLIFLLHLIQLVILFFLNASHQGLASQVLL